MAKKKKIEEINQTIKEIINQRPIQDIMVDNYIDISSYANNHRALPSFVDGCKDSYRRLIYAADLMYKQGELQAAVDVVGSVARWHPHSLDGIEGTMATFVNSGVFSGEGTFGSIDMDGTVNPHSALRYLHISLSPTYKELIGDLLKEVPMVESPNGPLEPAYIPLPLPLSLCLKTNVEGLGVGLKATIPSFSPWSLYQAYINDDPNLLEPNCNINIDKPNSDLKDIWEKGGGSITYYFNVIPSKDPTGQADGFLFIGDTWIFTPDFSELDDLILTGKVFTSDLTDKNGPKYFVGRVPGCKGFDLPALEKICKSIYYKSISYCSNITDGMSSYPIPLRSWIDYTYKNYINLITAVNEKRILECEFDISVESKVLDFVNYVLKNPKSSKEDIKNALKVDNDQLTALLDKRFTVLLRESESSVENALRKLNDKLSKLKSFDPKKTTEEIIKRM